MGDAFARRQQLKAQLIAQLIGFFIAIFAGAVAAVSGFGIGSILTPYLATQVDMKVAVAAVSIPHFIATAIRFWTLRQHLRRSIFIHFGVLSAIGGVFGASLHNSATNPVLKMIFASLLIFAGISGVTGLNKKVHLGKTSGWFAGALSGVFGGMVGNQGGIRSAALLAFNLEKEQFIATATAVGLVVDLSRMPVYLIAEKSVLAEQIPVILVLTCGCVIGTIAGGKIFAKVPADMFRIMVSSMILLLGVVVLLSPGRD